MGFSRGYLISLLLVNKLYNSSSPTCLKYFVVLIKNRLKTNKKSSNDKYLSTLFEPFIKFNADVVYESRFLGGRGAVLIIHFWNYVVNKNSDYKDCKKKLKF